MKLYYFGLPECLFGTCKYVCFKNIVDKNYLCDLDSLQPSPDCKLKFSVRKCKILKAKRNRSRVIGILEEVT